MIDFLLEAGGAKGRLDLNYFISEVIVEPIHILALGATRPKSDSRNGHILPRNGIGGDRTQVSCQLLNLLVRELVPEAFARVLGFSSTERLLRLLIFFRLSLIPLMVHLLLLFGV